MSKTRIVKRQDRYYPQEWVTEKQHRFLFWKWTTPAGWQDMVQFDDEREDFYYPSFKSLEKAQRWIETGSEFESDEVVWESER